jgi:hypothetical protein
MKATWRLLSGFGLAALAGCAGVRQEQDFPLPAPTVTVEKWAGFLRSRGYSRDLLGLKVTFDAKVTAPGATPMVRIVETEDASIGNAYLYNLPTNKLRIGDVLRVQGIIVDQPYSVWWIWTSTVEIVDAEQQHAADGAARRR